MPQSLALVPGRRLGMGMGGQSVEQTTKVGNEQQEVISATTPSLSQLTSIRSKFLILENKQTNKPLTIGLRRQVS